jgi:hypothetical protein
MSETPAPPKPPESDAAKGAVRTDSGDEITGLAPHEVASLLEDPTALELRDDIDTLVAELPVATFAMMVRRLQEENRLDLAIPHATAEQLTGVLDLNAWKGDRLNFTESRGWLLAVSDHFENADKARGSITDLIREMDPELWSLSLAPATAIAELDAEDDQSLHMAIDSMGALHTFETPDGYYVIGVPDDHFGRAAEKVIMAVYRDNLEEGRKLCVSIKYGLHAQDEEQLLRFRTARLADMGFPAWEDAMRIFTPLPRAKLDAFMAAEELTPRPTVDTELPVSWREGSELLRKVMARLDAGVHGERSREFLLLVNELIVAQKHEPGDVARQQAAVHQAQATLGLGLELLAGSMGEEDAMPLLIAAVERAGVRHLFRFAYGALSKLRKAALALHGQGRVSMTGFGSLLDQPWGASLRTLSTWYPQLPISVSENKVRPIANRSDLARATARISEAATLASLCFDPEGLGIDASWITRVDEPDRLRLGDLARSGLIHRLLPESAEVFVPLSPADLDWAKRELLLRDGTLAPRVEQLLRMKLAALGAEMHYDALAEPLLTRLRVELSGLELDARGIIDLTNVGGLFTIQSVGVWLKMHEGENN